MKRLLVLIVIIGSILLFGCKDNFNLSSLDNKDYIRLGIPVGAPVIKEIEVKTDKLVYNQGDPVKLIVTNNFNKEIILSTSEIRYPLFLQISLLKYNLLGNLELTSISKGWCACAECFPPPPTPIILKPNDSSEKTWDQKVTYVECKSGEVKSSETKFKEPGKYKFLLKFEFYDNGILKNGYSYSNDFEIKGN